ncbi:hypothetical protein D9756_004926 [Leucocoprinus leucothites]|uniref:RNA polymerase II-associated protein 1 C-terminal domain-containing protein n=1 Tax=Leucocoprinus leucothites TaxID=201217 RepID=A0A8H5G904_9AGAR|nr:hypothetical protein D9756_004926 [Leucoagaricus leucothites]
MSQNDRFLLGSVTERKPSGASIPPRQINPSVHGFPTAQHRSKSAFVRSREAARKSTSDPKEPRPQEPPIIVSTPVVTENAEPKQTTSDDWRARMSAENEMRVASMTDEEREAEKKEILERFGGGIGDVLKRARLAREKKAAKGAWPGHKHRSPPPPSEADTEAFKEMPEVPISEEEPAPSRPSGRGLSPPPALSRPHSRPSSRLDRKLRFAELGPNDVYVYESAPPSPKRRPLALPPAKDDGTAVSLGQWHGRMAPIAMPAPQPIPRPLQPEISEPVPADTGDSQPEEGTSEYIRRRYFPDAPANDPNLAWMQGNVLPESTEQTSASLRFDLNGNVIPISVATQLPTHLGLHHHAEGTTAGYTLDDVFLLSRSTVPAQRATMLGVLASIVLNLGKAVKGGYSSLEELVPKAEEVRKRIMAAGVEAMNERGGVGVRAIGVVWASIVGWDEDVMQIEGIELQEDSDTAISSLQLDFFIPQVMIALSQGDVLPESSIQLLTILHRLARQSNKIAESIVQTPDLLVSILHSFLILPMSTDSNRRLPEPAALQLLITLASASRSNAQALSELRNTKSLTESSKPKWLEELMDTEESKNRPKALERPANSLLRFITILPPSSPFPSALATNLLSLSLRFYCVLASYGLCSDIAKLIVEPFSQLSQYVISPACDSQALKIAWLDLQSAWTVCATDPHKTTPVHDLLWSQVVGWIWKDEVSQLAQRLGDQEEHWQLWDAVWRAEVQWLEGCKTNGIRGGETERSEFLGRVAKEFSDGPRGRIVLRVVNALQEDLEAADVARDLERTAFHAGLLSNAIQVWLACLPPHLQGAPPSPPFELPFPAISAVSAKLVTHPLWESVHSNKLSPRSYVLVRQLSGLLASYLALSRRLPGVSEELWVAQAFSILTRFMPGDEELAMSVIGQLLDLINLDWVNQRNIVSPIAIWDRGGLGILRPFFARSVRLNSNDRIAPLRSTPESIAISSTLRLPMLPQRTKFGLPFNKDWVFTPMNHLLRSADSEVFKQLPAGWDSSEAEITRATLFFSKLSRETLKRFSLSQLSISREEAIFGCMRVFMLEHGQPDNDSTGEVFRDPVVERLMAQTLEPYSYQNAVTQDPLLTCSLENVATGFLGESTPFFQMYTDFVGLYDAISFSESTFARLLLPPTSMRYAPDYRKHLWDDFGHIVKTIRTPCDQVLSSDLREYLHPTENDSQLIGAFLRALLKEPLQGFVRLIAVHHIASSIWPDLREEGSSEARAEKLIKAITVQGNIDVVREIVTYRQTPSGAIWVPPVCFEFVSEVAGTRLAWVTALGDGAMVSRVEGLLT